MKLFSHYPDWVKIVFSPHHLGLYEEKTCGK